MAVQKHYVLLGSTVLTQPDDASLKISDTLDDIPTFEAEISNNAANRTALGNINQDIHIYSSKTGDYSTPTGTVTASSHWAVPHYPPENAKDGNTSTFWLSNPEIDSWIKFDLGVSTPMIGIKAYLPLFTFDVTIRVLGCNDDLSYIDVGSVVWKANTAMGWQDIPFNSLAYIRYLKIIFQTGTTTSGMIYEIQMKVADEICTGRIEGEDSIEYLSRRKIRISGYHKMIELSHAFFLRLSSSGTLTPTSIRADDGGVFTNETTDALSVGNNDVTIPITAANDAFYIGYSKPFSAAKLKYSTAGVYNGTVVWEYWNGTVWVPLTNHTNWAASTVYSVGDFRKPTTSNGYIYRCTTAGTSGSTEPTWTTTIGYTVGDGTAIWTCTAILQTCLDETKGFTKAAGTRYLIIPNKPTDWASKAVGSSWVASTAFGLGRIIVPTSPNGYEYECTTPGTSGSTEPTWTTTIGYTVGDGTAIWTCRAPAYYIRMRVSTFTSATTQPWGDQIWLGDEDVARIQYDNIAANSILADVIAHANIQYGSSYTISECPSTNISLSGEYETHLKWISEIAAALTWTDGNGDTHEYDWWVDASSGIHIKQRRENFLETSPYNVSAQLQVLTRKEKYEIGNRIWGLGYGDGINQLRTIREHAGSQNTYGLWDATFSNVEIKQQSTLDNQGDTTLGEARAPAITYDCEMRFEDFVASGLVVGDWINIDQPEWNANNVVVRLKGFEMDTTSVSLEVSNEMDTVSSLINSLSNNVDVLNKTMQGATNIYQVGPVIDNFERTASNTYSIKMNIYIPTEVKIINKVLLNWQLLLFRSATKGSSSLTTTGVESAHNHSLGVVAGMPTNDDSVHVLCGKTGTGSWEIHAYAADGASTNSTGASHNHGMDHTHNYAISEAADESPLMELKIGSTIIAQYTGSQQNIDVSRYLAAGWNTIELYPITYPKKGRCQLDAVVQCFIESK